MNLVRAEWTKLFTTRAWLGLVLGGCAMAGGFVALITATAGQSGNGQSLPAVGTPEFEHAALAIISNATILTLILGIIGMTQEYRHRTATPTFLTTPRRWEVVVAKLAAYALAAIPFALAIMAVGVVVLEIFAGVKGAAPSLVDSENLRILAGVFGGLVIYAVMGVGVGALVRNQVGAIVGSLVYLFVVEGLVVQLVPSLRPAHKWLPGGALQAMTATLQGPNTPEVLQPWQGALLLLGYGLLAALLGTIFAVRRDVT